MSWQLPTRPCVYLGSLFLSARFPDRLGGLCTLVAALGRCLLADLARRLLRSRALVLARGLSCRPGCGPACSTSTNLLDEEFLGLPALPAPFDQQAGLQTAARPRLLGVRWVAVFRCDLTQLASLVRRSTRRDDLAALFPATERLRQAVALLLDQCSDPLTHGSDGLALLQCGLALLDLGHQHIQFADGKCGNIGRHRIILVEYLVRRS